MQKWYTRRQKFDDPNCNIFFMYEDSAECKKELYRDV